MWKNGFQIDDDGPFRPYTDPANEAFMADLKEGKVPAELRQKYPGGLGVGLNDKRDEEYVPPPPPKYISLGGGMELSPFACALVLLSCRNKYLSQAG